MKRFIVEVMLTLTMLVVGVNLATATAAAKTTKPVYGYVFKSHKGRAKQAPIYFKEGQIIRHGRTYIELCAANYQWLQEVGVNGTRPDTERTLFYARRSSVKRVKAIVAQRKYARSAYHVSRPSANFWDHPNGTVDLSLEQARGKDYTNQTVYVVARTKRVRQLSHSHIEVATLSQAGNLRRVIIQNNDDTAVVINVNVGPNTYYFLRADRTKTAVKEYKNELGYGSLTQTDYSPETQRLMLTFDASREGVSERASININSAGVLGQFSVTHFS
ncbi:hypothetical protein JK163_02180 [Levilactobacillus brevis]|uniref:hypothetical protein n=1 Tax=Levilactobacillus brevis TaxID=1580 RepID=UPI001BA5E3EF|nr:hypothetical protein [Levilactobacillus brevis]MBS1005125.1 hypothetical protein [Levilactobacillus brevis]MBS1012051.1 hypothetical protein [Levilactobacillus brevis]